MREELCGGSHPSLHHNLLDDASPVGIRRRGLVSLVDSSFFNLYQPALVCNFRDIFSTHCTDESQEGRNQLLINLNLNKSYITIIIALFQIKNFSNKVSGFSSLNSYE